MREFARIEEPPPIQRTVKVQPARRGAGPFTGWRPRLSAPSSFDFGAILRAAPPKPFVVALAALTVIGVQAWTLHRLAGVRGELAVAGTRLEEAHASLGMLWDTTKRLDEDQIIALGQLADSIRSVFAYAQGEVRLWETAFHAQEQRLDENASRGARNAEAITGLTTGVRAASTRLDQLGRAGEAQQARLVRLERADEAQQARLAGLELQDRTQGSALEALARRTEAQEASVRGATTTIGSLRQTLAGLDGELTALEDQLQNTGSAYGQLNTRMERLNGWVEEFRRAGLTGEAVDSRLVSLANELRRVRLRVDSLRATRPLARSGNPPG